MTPATRLGLDWRKHPIGPPRPCRICKGPAMCRDENNQPCHKVCAEAELNARARS